MKNKSIQSGIYLVIDPSMNEQILLDKLQLSLKKGIAAVQIWDNFKTVQNKEALIQKISSLCTQYKTPVLINNQWELLKTIQLDGVHFDILPSNPDAIREAIGRDILIGITCGNSLEDVQWAANNTMDYISFCSMFPSSSVSNCEIVSHETVKAAALIFNKPLFLAGGIDPKNINKLEALHYDGIAVISGIMNANNPEQAIDEYRKNIKSEK